MSSLHDDLVELHNDVTHLKKRLEDLIDDHLNGKPRGAPLYEKKVMSAIEDAVKAKQNVPL